MTPGKLRADVLADRAGWIRDMVAELGELPLDSREAFEADPRNVAAAESYLRRALEALLDLGRHMLAKGFARATSEYKEIADGLTDVGVLSDERGRLLREMAGYRNRLVHFYDEVTPRELFEICRDRRGDLEAVLEDILAWVRSNPERVDDMGSGG